MSAYMFHRVLDEMDDFDDNSGSAQLTTFLYRERRPLLHKLSFDNVIDSDTPSLLESAQRAHELSEI